MHSAPLCTSSAHPAHVHSRWPQGVIRSLGSISSTALDAEGAKAIFLSRLRKFHYSDCFLAALHACPTVPSPKRGLGGQRSTDRWLVLGYHPVWASGGIQKALQDFLARCRHLLALAGYSHAMGAVRVAWRNMLPAAAHVLRKTGDAV